ncbi:hypothetical protein ACFQZJ_16250 [Maribacter chungangensis]|uniref:Uncharacterized protein n=1 Tax=Maribacter chungangensis TaxID=1069117 RepID=A0ABW3B7Y8_9FLAO
MKKYISLVIGILAIINIAYGFANDQQSGSIFGIEMNIWAYRSVWAVIAIISFTDFYKATKKR